MNTSIEYMETLGREQLKEDFQRAIEDYQPRTWDELFDRVGDDKSPYATKFYVSKVRDGEITIELHDVPEGYYNYADVKTTIQGTDEPNRDELDGLADLLHEALLNAMYE